MCVFISKEWQVKIWKLARGDAQEIRNDPKFSIWIETTVGENNPCIPPTLEGWVHIIPVHGPLDGPLYTWAQYTPTPPPQSELPAQRCLRLDKKKVNTPRSLNNRRSGIQDWTRREYKGQIPLCMGLHIYQHPPGSLNYRRSGVQD